jgi:hypothetical protein
VKYKHPHLEEEFKGRSQVLKDMAFFIEKISMEWGIDPVITRVLEKIEGSSGVHEAGRAIDFRSSIYNEEQIVLLLDKVNTKFRRKDGKRTLIHHAFRGGAPHFHLQQSSRPDVLVIAPEPDSIQA